ncbi:unnamed protein product, partial [Citrullus colocynthis]
MESQTRTANTKYTFYLRLRKLRMLKSRGFGSPTMVAPANFCGLQRRLGLVHYRKKKNNNVEIKIKKKNGGVRLVSGGGIIKAALATAAEPTTSVITKVIVKKITGEITSSKIIKENEAPPKLLQLGFASMLLDLRTGSEKPPITVQAKLISEDVMEEIYEASLEVPSDFGEIGAVIVENHNENEMFVKEVDLRGLTSGPLTISCNSWVQPKTLVPTQRRVFFTDK